MRLRLHAMHDDDLPRLSRHHSQFFLRQPRHAIRSAQRGQLDAQFVPLPLEQHLLDLQLLDAIADGTFGIMKRPADRGRGLDGVAKHDDDYYNPVTEALEAR